MRVTRRSVRTRSGIEALVLAIALAGCGTGPDSAGTVERRPTAATCRSADSFLHAAHSRAGRRAGNPGRGRHHAGRHLPPRQPDPRQGGAGGPPSRRGWSSTRAPAGRQLVELRRARWRARTRRPARVLSLDVSHGLVTVPPDLAIAGRPGGQRRRAGADLRQSGRRRSSTASTTPAAATAALAVGQPAARHLAQPRQRPPLDRQRARPARTATGTITVDDPSGAPLAGPPDPVAGGVFSGDETNRSAASTEGLDHGAVATAHPHEVARRHRARRSSWPPRPTAASCRSTSSRGSTRWRPPGRSSAPRPDSARRDAVDVARRRHARRAGLQLGADAHRLRDRSAAPTGSSRSTSADDGTLFSAGAPRVHPLALVQSAGRSRAGGARGRERQLRQQHDARRRLRSSTCSTAATTASSASSRRGRSSPSGASRRTCRAFRVNGIAVSEDAQTIWVTAVMDGRARASCCRCRVRGGLRHADDGRSTRAQAGATDPVGDGRRHVRHASSPRCRASGPSSTGAPAATATTTPSRAAWATTADTFVTRVGRIDGGVFDPLDRPRRARRARPFDRRSSGFFCGLPTGVPPLANVTSLRSAMTLRGTALIDFVQNQTTSSRRRRPSRPTCAAR